MLRPSSWLPVRFWFADFAQRQRVDSEQPENIPRTVSRSFQRTNADFLEKDTGVAAMVLQPDVTACRPRAALGFVPDFLFWNRIAFGEVSDAYSIHFDDRLRTIQSDKPRGPFSHLWGDAVFRLGSTVEATGPMPRV